MQSKSNFMKNEKMKRFFLLIMASVLLLACNKTEKSNFNISGNIKNASGEMIFLYKLIANKLAVIDSLQVEEDGEFAFSGRIEEIEFIEFGFPNSQDIISLLVSPNENIKVDADALNFLDTYSLSGSKDSELMQQLSRQMRKTAKIVDSLSSFYMQNQEIVEIDSMKKNLDKLYTLTIRRQYRFSTNFLKKNKNSLSTLWALYQHYADNQPVISLQRDFVYFAQADSILSKRYPNSKLVKNFHRTISKQKQQMANHRQQKRQIKIGMQAPELISKTPDKREIALSSLRGKYVLIDFWASWHKACQAENENFRQIYKKHKRKNKFEILQVSLDFLQQDWEEAIAKEKLNWLNVSDLKQWKSESAILYNVKAIPANFLVSPTGKILATNLYGKQLSQKLDSLMRLK